MRPTLCDPGHRESRGVCNWRSHPFKERNKKEQESKKEARKGQAYIGKRGPSAAVTEPVLEESIDMTATMLRRGEKAAVNAHGEQLER